MCKMIILHKVGDGLNMFIKCQNIYDFGVDFGGNELKKCCYLFNNSFLLSHFHADHYNGLFDERLYVLWQIEKFYFPVMPQFDNSIAFFCSLLSMNYYMNSNYLIHSSVFKYIQQINSKVIGFQAVSQGDMIICEGKDFEILWPPKIMDTNKSKSIIKKAIIDFEKAKKENSDLNELFNLITQRKENLNIFDYNFDTSKEGYERKGINPIVNLTIQTANKSLKNAANRLSVAFRSNDILFLGDLENEEIEIIMEILKNKGQTNYKYLIAAHHGTHFDDSLKILNCEYCLVSNGKRMKNFFKWKYNTISKNTLQTEIQKRSIIV